MMQIHFEKMRKEHIRDLIGPMTRAFDDDAKNFKGSEKGGPPGYDDGSFLLKWAFQDRRSRALTIFIDQQAIGAAIFWWNKTSVSQLGNLFIDPQFQGLGIGRQCWEFIEKNYPSPSWRLETPIWAIRNHHFYEKSCGFKPTTKRGDQLTYRKKLETSSA